MYDNHTLSIQTKDGFVLQTVPNVSINTAWRILPWLIEDQVWRGHGENPWKDEDYAGETEIRRHVRQWFKDHCNWFDDVTNEGESVILGITVLMR
jgi:hypothetical protein